MTARRSRQRVAGLLTAALALAACGGSDTAGSDDLAGPAEPLARGAPTPPSFGLEAGVAGLVLVIRPEDCVSCVLTDPAREMRGIQRQMEGRVQFVTVVVTERGGQDRDAVEEFLAAERLESRVVVWTPEQHGAALGPAPFPSIYVTHGGRVVEVVDQRPATLMRIMARGQSLNDLLYELVGEGRETDDTQADDDDAGDTVSIEPGGTS